MKFSGLIAAVAAMAGALNLQAAVVSPTPQEYHDLGTAKFKPSDVSYKIIGADKADVQAIAALSRALDVKGGKTKLIVGESGDKAVKAYEKLIPSNPQGYYLKVTPKEVVVAGRDGHGTFYGVQTLLQLAADSITPVEIRDWPTMSRRGTIEGFYGNPWSHSDRLSQFDFYGRNKLDMYIYGPKDDPYHHSRWYEPYPEDKAREMTELAERAASNKVKFTWAMHPSNSIETDEDKQKALDKFQQMYDLGVRSFAIFFDDISAKSVDAQIAYLNFLDENFVKTHQGVEPMVVCPTIYNRAWNRGDYLPTMGKGLNPDIDIMWTGNSVCDMIGDEDCLWFTSETTRKPFIWLNYPVNDYGQHNLLMGPVVGNEPTIGDKVAAFCSNPMQYAEASKVALYQLADFAWNPADYDADKSWMNATADLEPSHTEAFRLFCLNNVDVAPSVHGLRFYGETPAFKELTEKYPSLDNNSLKAYRDYFRRTMAAAAELIPLAEAGNPLLKEVKEWIEAMKIQSEEGLAVVDMKAALDKRDAASFIEAYKHYSALKAKGESLVSRGFEGSIQSVRVKTGTLYVAPWINTNATALVDAFKASGMDYPAGLFPDMVVENGTYRIRYNGKWLGNPADSEYPVWQDEVDDINPNRQEWHITYNPATERYSIRNSKDERFISGNGRFSTKSFSPDWNTYFITEKDGRYAIRNIESSGLGYWNIDGDHLTTRDRQPAYIFEFIPAGTQL